jgi:hypothetical protein
VTTPSVDDIKAWSAVDFANLVPDDGVLQVLIDRAVGWFQQITGRVVDDTMPSEFEATTREALQRMVEVAAYQRQPDQIETVADFMLISSFSAGSYSETRRGLDEIAKAKAITGDPYLNSLLLGLLTPDQMDWWLAWWSGENPPAFEVTEVDWGLRSILVHPDEMITGATYGVWSW